MKTELSAIAFKATSHPEHRFQNLYGLLDTEILNQSWGQLNKQAAAGIDGITIPEYQSNLPENIKRLEEELRNKQYCSSDINEFLSRKPMENKDHWGYPR
jgi:retron-type reverse transcriptase